jgi:hypothetical protein
MKLIFLLFLVFISLPGLCQEEIYVDEVYEQRKTQAKTAVSLNESTEQLTESVVNIPEELEKLGHKEFNLAAMADERVIKLLQNTLKQDAFKNVSLKEIKDLILEKAKGHPLENFFKNNPRVLNCLAELLKDKNVMISALGLFIKKRSLKLYFVLWLLLMILAWYIKRSYRMNKNLSFLKSISISLITTMISLSLFYIIFYDELSPAFKIIKKNFF